jgi:hypothetical protein
MVAGALFGAYRAAAFDVRAGLFAGHKMSCDDLARGLVQVEDRWTAYLDAAQVAARHLRDEVDAIEGRFGRTGCPRP